MTGMDGSRRWRDWVMLVLAVWLFVSPWLLGFATGAAPTGGAAVASAGFTTAAWNAWVVGIVVAALAIWAIAMFAEWQDWLTGILGVWLVVAPWVLGFSAMAAVVWDHVIVGALIVALSAWELWAIRHEGSRATA
jgi:SPW repeat